MDIQRKAYIQLLQWKNATAPFNGHFHQRRPLRRQKLSGGGLFEEGIRQHELLHLIWRVRSRRWKNRTLLRLSLSSSMISLPFSLLLSGVRTTGSVHYDRVKAYNIRLSEVHVPILRMDFCKSIPVSG